MCFRRRSQVAPLIRLERGLLCLPVEVSLKIRAGILVVALVSLLSACSGAGAPPESSADSGLGIECTGDSPSFANDVTPILSGCGGAELCHGGLIRPGGGGGSGPWPYDSLVKVMASRDVCAAAGVLVEPGSLEKSYLIHKLTGVDMCPNTNRMPDLGSPLPEKEIQTIADWICQGAKNN
jgi:hypothetical protein